MKIYITDKGIEEELHYIKNGVDWVEDFVDSDIDTNDETDRYECDSEKFEYWRNLIAENKELDSVVEMLKDKGIDVSAMIESIDAEKSDHASVAMDLIRDNLKNV